MRARFVTNPDGSIGGQWAPDPPIRQAISSQMAALTKAYHPEPIRVTALAVYAVPKSPNDLIRSWYPSDDPETRGRVEQLYQLTGARFEGHANWFKKFAPQGRVTEISGDHYLFLTNPNEVVQQIEAFVATLSERR